MLLKWIVKTIRTKYYGILAEKKNFGAVLDDGSLKLFVAQVRALKRLYFIKTVKYFGIMGVATIERVPETPFNIPLDWQKLWVGCEIEGFIMSPNRFDAASWEACRKALIQKHGNEKPRGLIEFWERRLNSDETLSFQDGCFSFRKKKINFFRPFGNPLAGKIILLRR